MVEWGKSFFFCLRPPNCCNQKIVPIFLNAQHVGLPAPLPLSGKKPWDLLQLPRRPREHLIIKFYTVESVSPIYNPLKRRCILLCFVGGGHPLRAGVLSENPRQDTNKKVWGHLLKDFNYWLIVRERHGWASRSNALLFYTRVISNFLLIIIRLA